MNERFKKPPAEPVFGVPEQENAIPGLFDPMSDQEAPKIKVKKKVRRTVRVPCRNCGNPLCGGSRTITEETEVDE
jgi:hypothetical protein